MGSVRVFDWLEHHANFRGTEKAVCDLESGRSYNWIDPSKKGIGLGF
jgi:hypothetical protein